MHKKDKIIYIFINLIPVLCGIAASLLALGTLTWWLNRPLPANDLVLSKPGLDNVPPGAREQKEKVIIGEHFKNFNISCTHSFQGKWERFRGNDFTNISKEQISLSEHWPESGPPILWKIPLGEGHAGPAVKNAKLYLLDYLEEERADALRCFCTMTGKELWRRWYNVDTKRNHGRSRTIPAVADKFVVTIGPKGHVMCVDSENGDFKWGIDLVKEYQAEIPQWYTGQCPLIDEDTVVLAPGAPDALLIGVDLSSGIVKWQTPNPDLWKMSHSSIMPMIFKGEKMYVYFSLGGVSGIQAEGEQAGEILWKNDRWAPSVVAPSPVIMDKGRIYLTAGYGAGSTVLQLIKQDNKFIVNQGPIYKPRDALSSEQQTALYYKEMLFSIMPKDAGIRREQITACSAERINEFINPLDNSMRFGLGPYLIADDKFYILDDNGTLSMLKFKENKFIPLSSHKILDGFDAWAPMVLTEGLLFLRDANSMACIDLSADQRWSKKQEKKNE